MVGLGMVALGNYWEAVGTGVFEICSVSEQVNRCTALGMMLANDSLADGMASRAFLPIGERVNSNNQRWPNHFVLLDSSIS